MWPLPQHEVKSADGTVLRAYWSSVPRARVTVVLAADLAEVVPDVWQPQVEYLAATGVRFIAWEYRGTRRAGTAPPARRYDVAAHLEDLTAVIRAAGVDANERIVILSSGVGVRVALEAALALPDLIRGLVLIGGAAGWRYRLLCNVAYVAAGVAQRTERPRERPAALLNAAAHATERAMQLAGMSLLEVSSREESADSTARVLDAVASSLRELGTDAAIEQARRIKQPALVMCGAEDARMPSALAHQLARRLERSRVLIVPRATSRLGSELPDLVNLEVERFLAELSDEDGSGGEGASS